MQEKNRRNLAKIVIILLGILIPSYIFLGFWKGSVYAATSDTVNLQGKIVRNDVGYEGLNVTAGSPTCVVTGSGNDTCDFRVRYYDASSGGNLLLTEEFSNIEIGQYLGVFNLSLGSDISPTAGVYSSFSGLVQGEDDVYVEMGFDPSGSNTYTEVFTRMPLEATAYAIRAKYADNATGATAMSWSGLQDPSSDLTLQHTTKKTLFNWATGTGTDDLFTLTSNASATGTGALMNVQTGAGATLMPLRVRAGTLEGLMVNNQGRVGIGTTSPTSALQVVGNVELGEGSTTRQITAYNAARTNSGSIELYNLATGNMTLATDFASGDIILQPGESGNVGIGTTSPFYTLDVSGGTGIVAQFSGRVIGADAVNTNEFVTKSQLDSVGGSITTYWQRSSPNLSPINANDNILPNTSGNLGAAGSRWGTIYGNIGSFSSLQGNSTLTLLPSADGINAVNIKESTGTTEIFSVDTINSRIGIGTASPDSALHIAGQVKITGGTPGANKVLTSDVVGLASWANIGDLGAVNSVTGTTNQITASPTTGDVVLSIPTDFRAPGTVNAVNGIYTGASAGTQRIDASGNLLNIGTITFAGADVSMSRTLANVLSLAAGDSFNLVSGSLQVGSTEVITSGRLLMAADGSATTPAFSFSGDTNTGMYSGGTDILKLVTAGLDRVTILADGKVGIGTASPGKVLDVAGDIRLRGNSATLNFYGNTNPTDIAYLKYDEGVNSFDIAASKLDIRFLNMTGFGESMRITSVGLVGIGTTNPTSLFSVGSSSEFQVDTLGDIIKIKNLSYTWPTAHTTNGYLKNNGTGGLSWTEVNAVQSTGTPYGSATEGPLAFWTSPTTISAPTPYGLYWDDINQYLGIGTNTPSAPLDIAGGTGGSIIKNSSGDITIEPAANLIISKGDVGIGVTVPLAKLHVKGNQILLKNEADADLGLVLDSGSTATYRDVIYFKDRGTDIFGLEKTSTNAFQLYDYAGTGVSRILVEAGTNSGISFRSKGTGDFSFITDTTTRVTIKSDGNVGIGTTSPATKLELAGTSASIARFNVSSSLINNKIGAIEFRNGSDSYMSKIESYASDTTYSDQTDLRFFTTFQTIQERVRINSLGNVGIGTTSPGYKLDVVGDGRIYQTATNTAAILALQGTGDVNAALLRMKDTDSNIEWLLENRSISSNAFNLENFDGSNWTTPFIVEDSTPTNTLYLSSSGNVGIGTTSPAGKLDVNGEIYGQHATVVNQLVTYQSTFETTSSTYVDVPNSSKTATLPAGTAVISWSLSGYTGASGTDLLFRPCIGASCGPAVNVFMNQASSHMTWSGHWVTTITTGGSLTTKIQVLREAGTSYFRTDLNDHLSWNLIVFRD